MKWKNILNKFKNPNFWIAIGSVVVVLLSAFGVDMGGEVANMVVNSVCGLLVVFGIFVDNGKAGEVAKEILSHKIKK